MEPDWQTLVRAARANLHPAQFPDIDKEMVLRILDEVRNSSRYPDVVAHNVMLARELCVAGCLFYELCTVSLHYSAVACEVALRERFFSKLPLPFYLVRKNPNSPGLEEKEITSPLAPLDALQMLSSGWRLRTGQTQTDPAKFGSLIRWAVKESVILPTEVGWFEGRQRLRNMTAHGHSMVGMGNWALSTLRRLSILLNRLYPDEETTAYDEANRLREEERRRANDIEYLAMSTLVPANELETDDE